MSILENIYIIKHYIFILELLVQCRKRNNAAETTNSFDYFDKGWESYKQGFGDIGSDYWIGLETLHEATSQAIWILRVAILNTCHLFLNNVKYPKIFDVYLINTSIFKKGFAARLG